MGVDISTAIIAGYRIPRNIWEEAMEYCEKHLDEVPEDWDQFFINTNAWTANGETFFGEQIISVDEDSEAVEIDNINVGAITINRVRNAFRAIFQNLPFDEPDFKKYLCILVW